VRNLSPEQWHTALTAAGFAPGPTTRRRLRLEFRSWIERMSTPELHVRAIRSLQDLASAPVRSHFAIEPDGSFTLDTTSFEARPA
jgi:hypothetical protein